MLSELILLFLVYAELLFRSSKRPTALFLAAHFAVAFSKGMPIAITN